MAAGPTLGAGPGPHRPGPAVRPLAEGSRPLPRLGAGALNPAPAGLTVTSWNLQGSHGLDPGDVVGHLETTGTDVLVLQEVQRRQARALADRLEPRSFTWGFKHWPVTTRSEGMAVLGLTVPVHRVRTCPLTRRWRVWSWRRRIFQVGGLDAAPGFPALRLLNVHLTPHGTGEAENRRAVELRTVLAAATAPAVVAGDFNAEPRSGPWQQMAAAGFSTPDTGPTKWRGDPSDRPPERHIDYIWGSAGIHTIGSHVPRHGDPGFSVLPRVSDHLPLTVTFSPGLGGPGVETHITGDDVGGDEVDEV